MSEELEFIDQLVQHGALQVPCQYGHIRTQNIHADRVVATAIDTTNGNHAIIYNFNIKKCDNTKWILDIYQELLVRLHLLQHPNLVNLLHCYTPQSSASGFRDFYTIIETLDTCLYYNSVAETKYTHLQVSKIIYQLLNAIQFIHSKGFILRDLSTVDIWVNIDGDVKIDPGKCSSKNQPYYIAPEIILLNDESDKNSASETKQDVHASSESKMSRARRLERSLSKTVHDETEVAAESAEVAHSNRKPTQGKRRILRYTKSKKIDVTNIPDIGQSLLPKAVVTVERRQETVVKRNAAANAWDKLPKETKEKADTWLVGCVMLEMLMGKTILLCTRSEELEYLKLLCRCFGPLPDTLYNDVRAEISECLSTYQTQQHTSPSFFEAIFAKSNMLLGFSKEDDELAKDLLEKLLALDPDERLSTKEALNHPYVSWWKNNENNNKLHLNKNPRDFNKILSHKVRKLRHSQIQGEDHWREMLYGDIQTFSRMHPFKIYTLRHLSIQTIASCVDLGDIFKLGLPRLLRMELENYKKIFVLEKYW